MISHFGSVVRILIVVCFICVSIGTNGCDGTDTREEVDDVVEEVTGKKDLERYQKMKGELDKINKRQSKKYDQLNTSSNTE